MDNTLKNISEMLQKGKAMVVGQLVQQALDEGLSPQTILDSGLMAGMKVINEKFRANTIFVPQVMVASRAMNRGVEVLKPAVIAEGLPSVGTVILGTVCGDLHDIGKNLVKMMMESRGIQVVDIGIDVPGERFIEAAREHAASLVCCSALLTTTMKELKTIVALRDQSPLRGSLAIMVGGAPVSRQYSDKIGAEYYTEDAITAAETAAMHLQGAF